MSRKGKTPDFDRLLAPDDGVSLTLLVVGCTAPGVSEKWVALMHQLASAESVIEEPYSTNGRAVIAEGDSGLAVRWMMHDGAHSDPGCAHWSWEFRRKSATNLSSTAARFEQVFREMLNNWPEPRKHHEYSVTAYYRVHGAKPLRKISNMLRRRVEISGKTSQLSLEVDEVVFSAKVDGTRRGTLSVSPSSDGEYLWVGWTGVLKRRMSANIFNLLGEMSWKMARTVIA